MTILLSPRRIIVNDTVFSSKLEAQWRNFLAATGHLFAYETSLLKGPTGQRWRPDFDVYEGDYFKGYLECKGSKRFIRPYYIKNLYRIAKNLKTPVYLVFSDPLGCMQDETNLIMLRPNDRACYVQLPVTRKLVDIAEDCRYGYYQDAA